MNYKLFIYVISMVVVAFALSAIDMNRFFKQGKVVEANTFAIVLILALSGLLSDFIIKFLEVSKIL